ncbi:TetR/AcrR family transcriptional regulator [Gordonia sp. DT219]|uniref:TetR/AcrR family transcriptional regulator n=1 Tax=Gordonia sp. DT219 TaxID=3416658 RepID=UPI003CF893C6
MAPTRPQITREHLLATAERLFLTEGFDTVSVRAICSAAAVNPAAVHYHFGSKEDLIAALLEERLAPLWADQLDAAESVRRDVAGLVAVVVAPLIRLQNDPVGHLHLQLLARFVDAHPDAAWSRPWFRLEDWADLLTELVPDLDRRTARRRWGLAFTLVLTRFGAQRRLSEDAIAALRSFVIAGLGAPVAGDDR